MNPDLEELKKLLRSKSFALDDVIPLARSAAVAIDRLEEENRSLLHVLKQHQKQGQETVNNGAGNQQPELANR